MYGFGISKKALKPLAWAWSVIGWKGFTLEHALAMVGWAEWDLPSDCCRGEILFGKARGISEFHATFELWQEEPICSISVAIDCDVVDRDEKREDDDDVKSSSMFWKGTKKKHGSVLP